MNTYTLTDLTTGLTHSVQAATTAKAVSIARQRGWIGAFYSITINGPSINRWNLNRGFC